MAGPAQAADQQVTVGDNFFSPVQVSVSPGESVTWSAAFGTNFHNVAFDDGAFTSPSPARQGPWTATRSFTAGGSYRYYCQIHGAPGGQGMSGVVQVNAAANAAPVASFTVSPNPAQTGQSVSFDGSGSSDADGSVVRHGWDLDGNGSFETDTGTTPTASRSYATPGALTVGLRVTDNHGATAETTRSLQVDAPPSSPRPAPSSPAPPGGTGPGPTFPSGPLPPDFTASRRSVAVSRSGRFSLGFRATPGLTGTIRLRSLSRVRLSATRRIDLGTKRFTVPISGVVKVSWKLAPRALRVLRRKGVLRFRGTVTLRDLVNRERSATTAILLRSPRRSSR